MASTTDDGPGGAALRSDGSSTSTQRLAEKAKQQAKDAWNDTRQSARATLDERRRGAADGVGDLAGALRDSAGHLGADHKETLGRLVGHAADGLDRLSGTLRNKDLDTMLRDVQSLARNQPAVFFGAALAAGFLAVRFLTSSQREPAGDGAASPADPGGVDYGPLH